MQIINEKSDMRTIPQTVAKYRGSDITDRAVRRWVKEQAFPVVRVGVKVLINQSIFEQFLREELNE
jgi:hypothetical protein